MNYRKIDPATIQVAAAYQRAINRGTVSAITKAYEPDAFGVLLVASRGNGSLWCIDGQNRLESAIRLGLKTVPCLVVSSSGQEFEAKLFRILNSAKPMSRKAKLWALYVEKDPQTRSLYKTVEKLGFKIPRGGSGGWPHIHAVGALEKLHGANVLADALTVVSNVWPGDADALQSPILEGLGLALSSGKFTVAILCKRLKKVAPAQLIAKADARKMRGGNRSKAVLEVIEQL